MEDIKNNYYIKLSELVELLLTKKTFIIIFTLIGVVTSLLFAIYTPSVYKSTAILAPSSINDSINNSVASSSSALAGLIGLPSKDNNLNKSQEAIKRLTTFTFFLNHFLPEINIEDLTSVQSWDSNNNQLIYDSRKYNHAEKKWKKNKPSAQDAFEYYKKIINIKEDTKTPFIEISITHNSPFIAKKWTQIIISKINETIRDNDENVVIKNMEFLKNYYEKTDIMQLQNAIVQLQESQINALMKISIKSDNYVFSIIDNPIVPENKFWPNRTFIVVMGSILSFIISIFGVLIIYYRNFL